MLGAGCWRCAVLLWLQGRVRVGAAAAEAEGAEEEGGGGGAPEDGAAADPVRRAAVRHRPRAQHPVPHRPGAPPALPCFPHPYAGRVPACSPQPLIEFGLIPLCL